VLFQQIFKLKNEACQVSWINSQTYNFNTEKTNRVGFCAMRLSFSSFLVNQCANVCDLCEVE